MPNLSLLELLLKNGLQEQRIRQIFTYHCCDNWKQAFRMVNILLTKLIPSQALASLMITHYHQIPLLPQKNFILSPTNHLAG